MEEILEHTLLYDFYGELLTSHQQQIYEDVVFNDLSYTEVAKEMGISRQGVYDQIRRISKILTEYEEKLKLVDKFLKTKKLACEIRDLTDHYLQEGDDEDIRKIRTISEEMLKLQNW